MVLRRTKGEIDILAFRHPVAGVQLVKGTLDAGEDVIDGALRELAEQSGLEGVADGAAGWTSDAIAEGQRWHFVPVEVTSIPEQFVFLTQDDGGHVFSFFWWPLLAESDKGWLVIYVRALAEIRARAS